MTQAENDRMTQALCCAPGRMTQVFGIDER